GSRRHLVAGGGRAGQDAERNRGEAERCHGEGAALAGDPRAHEPDRLRHRRLEPGGIRPLHARGSRSLGARRAKRKHQARLMETVYKVDPLTRAIEAIVAAGGSEPRETKLVAENLVTANLLGHDSHGIGMIPRYIDAVLEGGLAPNAHPKATLDAGALLALDGCKGYGQAIGGEAMQMAMERTKKHGSCVMTLGNTHHLGRIGHWAEMAVAQGCVSIHFVNV